VAGLGNTEMELVPVVDVLLLAADAHSLARSGQLLALESVIRHILPP
jgi:hypothetical protein